jgi:RNA polymerase sigma factor (sigma-70 family)
MSGPECATELFHRWRSGDEEAAAELFSLYSSKLNALAERNLSHRLIQRVDGVDVVQSVFRSFFTRSARGEFHIKNSVELWRLLVKITLSKARSQARRHTSAKRDVNAEIHGVEEWMLEAFTGEPGPLEAATLLDQIETVLEGLPDAYGEVLALSLEGMSRTEIAQKLGISRQTVYRALTLLKDRLQKSLAKA